MNHRTIRTAITAALLCLLAIGARADLAALVPYTVPVETVKPLALSVMSGESATWQFSFTEGGVAKDLTGAQSAAMAYTRTGVTYQVDGSLHSLTGGVVRVAWVATNATPAGIYNYVLSVVTGNVALCRARGVLTVGPAMEAVDGLAPVWTLNAAIAAESLARLSGDLVAMTNWQAIVYSLTNGAALGATALQAEADTLATVTARGGTTTSAITLGNRYTGDVGESSFAHGLGVVASGLYSHSVGNFAIASGDYSQAIGNGVWASGDYSFAKGLAAYATNDFSFAWSGSAGKVYYSHGDGTYNLNPVGGLSGLWIGESTLAATINASNAADRAYADAAVVAAPAWIGITNLAAAVTITNSYERPVYLYATGTVSVAFSGLRTPMPLYLVLRGPDSLTFPGAYYIGGGTWQTNMSNHFVVWKYGTNLFVNPVTATED